MKVVLPVKRFSEAKRRLGDSDLRDQLARAMVLDVITALAEHDVIVVSGEPEVAPIARQFGFSLLDDPDTGHSAAAQRGIEAAAALGATVVALLAGDCPLVDPAELEPGTGVQVFADRHGDGTNGLILDPLDAIIPAFGPGSRARHVALAEAAGVACTVRYDSSIAIDADTPGDLAALADALTRLPDRAPNTRALLL